MGWFNHQLENDWSTFQTPSTKSVKISSHGCISRRQLLVVISKQLHSRARTREVTLLGPKFVTFIYELGDENPFKIAVDNLG